MGDPAVAGTVPLQPEHREAFTALVLHRQDLYPAAPAPVPLDISLDGGSIVSIDRRAARRTRPGRAAPLPGGTPAAPPRAPAECASRSLPHKGPARRPCFFYSSLPSASQTSNHTVLCSPQPRGARTRDGAPSSRKDLLCPQPELHPDSGRSGLLAPGPRSRCSRRPGRGNSRRSPPRRDAAHRPGGRAPGCPKRPSGTTADTVPLPAPGRPGHAHHPQSPRPAAPPGHPPASPWPSGYTAPQRPDHQSGAPAAMSKLPRPAPPAARQQEADPPRSSPCHNAPPQSEIQTLEIGRYREKSREFQS